VTTTPAMPHQSPSDDAPKWWRTALSIVARFAAGAIIAGVGGGEEESAAAVVGGVLIAASAIPTWYRAKIERLKAAHGSNWAVHRIEERMVDLERRQQEQLDRIEREQTEQIADLEERVEFAERLLTKQREQIGPG